MRTFNVIVEKDPDTGVFTATGTTGLQRQDGMPTATLLMTGKILVAGGAWDAELSPVDAKLYDFATGMFIVTGNMITGHVSHTATLLPDGTVLIFGLAEPRDESALPALVPNPETESLEILRAPAPLAFPLHSQVVAEYFARRGPRS